MPVADRYTYWLDNIHRTLSNSYNGDNPPYGSATTAGAGRTAVIEAWGEHVGLLFADMQYGVECELSRRRNRIGDKERARYIYRASGLEQFDPNSGGADAWIPEGIFWDLLDDGVHNLPSTSPNDIVQLDVTDPVVDNVQGVTHADMFRAITQNAPTEILTVKDAIKSDYISSRVSIDSLFSEYGY